MKWIKKGLVYSPKGDVEWAKHSALTPTPLMLNEKVIRIYAGFRDENGVSRIGYVDVEAENPSNVIRVSKSPVLDIGEPGTFDDNGVILGEVLRVDSDVYMYYVGFQLVKNVKFLAYSGLAISKDGGNTFQRYSTAPILDRSAKDKYIAAIHSVIFDEGIWKVWYASGNGWEYINDQPFPQYNIKYLESSNPYLLNKSKSENLACVEVKGNEYRIGRPRVYKINGKYFMFYTKGTTRGDYVAGFAESCDGKNWIRRDDELGLYPSNSGWDSLALCYPSLIRYREKIYAFYNGNNMGREGFGYAEMIFNKGLDNEYGDC